MKQALIRRFSLTERLAHWVNALGFLTCLATGTVMAFKARIGITQDALAIIRNVHLTGASVFVLGPMIVWLTGRTGEMFRWIRDALRWTWSDIVWLLCPLFRAVRWSVRIPAADRFNAGQKINVAGMFVIKWTAAATGLVMWRGHGWLAAHQVHLLAFLLAFPLLGGHLFMAVLNPRTNHSLRGMIGGWVREDWARHHHGRWIEREGQRIERRTVDTRPPAATGSTGAEMPAADPVKG
ncbi:MAG: cytochrome b/b6 domain-containing protein [Candidatus Sumerlaeia bacterium]|nr:cytochrome b/b6 domain-containing protein [Candidatus Sumerlaeia bacterium]